MSLVGLSAYLRWDGMRRRKPSGVPRRDTQGRTGAMGGIQGCRRKCTTVTAALAALLSNRLCLRTEWCIYLGTGHGAGARLSSPGKERTEREIRESVGKEPHPVQSAVTSPRVSASGALQMRRGYTTEIWSASRWNSENSFRCYHLSNSRIT